jgi:hypothetical protein
MTQAQVVKYLVQNVFKPLKGTTPLIVTIRAGHLHRHLNLQNRMPTVCGALREVANNCSHIKLLSEKRGPQVKKVAGNGANVWLEYSVNG